MNLLFASLIWGSVGLGYFIYGKKQTALVPMFGGVLIMAASYFAGTALMMSLISVGLIAAIHICLRQGW
jgi:hypothetical protein